MEKDTDQLEDQFQWIEDTEKIKPEHNTHMEKDTDQLEDQFEWIEDTEKIKPEHDTHTEKDSDQQEGQFEWVEEECLVDPKASCMNLGYYQALVLDALPADGKSAQEDMVEEKNHKRTWEVLPRSHKRIRWRQSSSKCAKNRYAQLDEGIPSTVSIADVRFSQAGCSSHFQCGGSVLQLVQDLLHGKVGLSAPFLRLNVFHMMNPKTRQPVLRCIDNRRLYALEEFAKKSGQEHMMVNVQLHDLNTCSLKLLQRYRWNSDNTDGRSIKLRKKQNNTGEQKKSCQRRNRTWVL